MSDAKKKMDQAIKEIVIPILRSKGFKGSLPHFRREKDGNIDILTFQYSLYGGKFCIEIGKYSSKGIKNSKGENIPANKVKTYQLGLGKERPRLSPTMQDDHWFVFENETILGNVYNKLAKEALSLINNQAEKWWSDKRNISKNSL